MNFIERNIILLVTFSIVILYMIKPANADAYLCMIEIKLDGFITDSLADGNFDLNIASSSEGHTSNQDILRENINRALQRKALESYTTPHGAVYHKILINFGGTIHPFTFCSRIYGHGRIDIFGENEQWGGNEQWGIIINELQITIKIYLCLANLSEDNFNSNLGYRGNPDEIRLNNYMIAQINRDFLNTPHGKAYHMLLTFYEEYRTPMVFCQSISRTDESSPILENLRSAINIHIDVLIEMCMADLKKDRYNTKIAETDLEAETICTKNHSRAMKLDAVIRTPHGQGYTQNSKDCSVSMPPYGFCKWIYKDIIYMVQWKNIKSLITHGICMQNLKMDKFNILENDWSLNFLMVNLKEIKRKTIKSMHGLKYWSNFSVENPIEEHKLNAHQFCEIYSSIYKFKNN